MKNGCSQRFCTIRMEKKLPTSAGVAISLRACRGSVLINLVRCGQVASHMGHRWKNVRQNWGAGASSQRASRTAGRSDELAAPMRRSVSRSGAIALSFTAASAATHNATDATRPHAAQLHVLEHLEARWQLDPTGYLRAPINMMFVDARARPRMLFSSRSPCSRSVGAYVDSGDSRTSRHTTFRESAQRCRSPAG
jgi:hypothetical protein